MDISFPEDIISAIAHYLMVHYATAPAPKQYSLKKELKIFGEKGKDAVTHEFTQLHMLNVYSPLSALSLSSEDKKKALSSLIFLKEKLNGTIKARKCVDGSKQREHYAKEETTSPTVGTNSLFITAAINAHKEHDVATADLPGAFLHADNDDFTIIQLNGILAELMVKTAPNNYLKYITTDHKGQPTLYLQAQKAIYGMLKSALLFYRKLVANLCFIGFKLNPYNPCIANQDINGQQQTVIWHIDNFTIPCMNPDKNTKLINWLRSIYGKVVFIRGPKHTILECSSTTPSSTKSGSTWDDILVQFSMTFPKQSLPPHHLLPRIISSKFATHQKHASFLNPKLLLSTTQSRNSSS
jgi:hypothetical protein